MQSKYGSTRVCWYLKHLCARAVEAVYGAAEAAARAAPPDITTWLGEVQQPQQSKEHKGLRQPCVMRVTALPGHRVTRDPADLWSSAAGGEDEAQADKAEAERVTEAAPAQGLCSSTWTMAPAPLPRFWDTGRHTGFLSTLLGLPMLHVQGVVGVLTNPASTSSFLAAAVMTSTQMRSTEVPLLLS